MSTKLILHGGFNKVNGPVQRDDAFFQEIFKDVPEEAKVLLVYFAEKEEKVASRILEDKEEFSKNCGAKNPQYKVATEATFEEDIRWADVVYLHGGKTVKLMEIIRKFRNLGELFLGKTIAGDSAGANSLCRVFFSKNSKEIGEGLGILTLKIVVHYEDGQPNSLENVEPQLETLFLREYETKVFYI